MKKSTTIFIGVVFVASIIFISFFGMKMSVYNEYIPITQIVCRNETDSNVIVGATSTGKTLIKTPFSKPADKEKITGTMIQLLWKVEPENATSKSVKFVYDESNPNIEFYKTEDGEDTGLVLFYGKTMFNVTIMSTDGRRIMKEITLWAY